MKKIYSLLLLGGLLFFGVQNVWGYTMNGRVYFDNTNSNWATPTNGSVFLFIETNNGNSSIGNVMSAVTNTKLFYWSGTDGGSSVAALRFASMTYTTDGWGWWDMSSWTRLNGNSSCKGMTGTSSIDVNGKSVLFVSASGTYNNTSAVNLSSVSTYDSYEGLNHTQKIYQKVTFDSGSSYGNPSVSLANISVSGFAFNNENSCPAIASPNNFSAGESYSDYKSNDAGYTSTMTISVSNVLNGFTFSGFYNTTTRAAISHTTSNGVYSCSYDVTQANNIEARFTAIDYSYSPTSSGWGTLCLPYNVAADGHSGVTFYSISGVDNETSPTKLYIGEETEALSAGYPYIVHASSASTITAGTSMAAARSNGALVGTYTSITIVGTGSDYFVISGGEVHPANSSCTVGANRAYIDGQTLGVYDPNNPAPGRRIVEMPMAPNTTTALKDVMVSEKAVKFFENGQLLIERNGIIYDVTGRIVK